MVNIILSGCNGRMGQVVTRIVKERDDCCVAAGIDIKDDVQNDYPVFKKLSDFEGCADVLIDFSHPSQLSSVLEYCRRKNIPAVICTTGLTDEQKNELTAAAESTGIFFSANMSIGINLITELAKTAASVLSGFDIEIVEKHHNQKIDAPSGTALSIADAISEVRTQPTEYVYDRHSVRRKRKESEIGIHAVRGGTIVGEHTVIFAGADEVIEIKHSAASREVFATGAVRAAIYMKDKKKGMYNMSDLING